MSRAIVSSVAMVAALAVLVGCASKPKTTSDRDVFGPMQEKASKITANGGLAAVGIGESKAINIAIEKAKTRARTEMAFIINTKVEALRKDFSEEIGEGKSAEFNTLFSSAAKQLTSQEIAGTAPTDIKYETKDGITTAHALIEQNPKILAAALENASSANKSMYTRFRASQAFKELDEEVKKYEEFKSKQGGM